MNNDFLNWLAQNGLTTAFVTNAGDGFYTNKEKKFGVLRKNGEYGAHSFYFDDIIEIQTYDDEHLIVEWSKFSAWKVSQRSTRFSTNEVYMNIRLRNQTVLRMQIFKAKSSNISRNSSDHVNLFTYACQISQIVYNCANGF